MGYHWAEITHLKKECVEVSIVLYKKNVAVSFVGYDFLSGENQRSVKGQPQMIKVNGQSLCNFLQ